MVTPKKPSSSGRAVERRKHPRKPVLDSFHVFVVLPHRGSHRLKVHDVSAEGLRFDFDAGAADPAVEVEVGSKIDARFYLNATLAIPLQLEVVRVEKPSEKTGGVRRVGTQVLGKKSNEFKAFADFVHMLDTLAAAAEIAS